MREWSTGILLSIGIGCFSCCFLSLFVKALQIPDFSLLRFFNPEETETEASGAGLLFVELLLAPFLEELIFRKLLFGKLRTRMNALYGAGLVSVLFAVLHLNLAQMFYAFLLSLIFCELAERTGNFYFCVAAHMAANVLAYLVNSNETLNAVIEACRIPVMIAAFLLLTGSMFLLVRLEHRFAAIWKNKAL